jgi:hypothetical protein
MRRAYYWSSIADFLSTSSNEIIGELTRSHARTLEQTQLKAGWSKRLLKRRPLVPYQLVCPGSTLRL